MVIRTDKRVEYENLRIRCTEVIEKADIQYAKRGLSGLSFDPILLGHTIEFFIPFPGGFEPENPLKVTLYSMKPILDAKVSYAKE